MSSICILIALCWPRLDPPGLSDSDIRAAIDTIKTAIIDRHHKRRHWDPAKMPTGESTRQRVGGYTALACLALVTAGHPWHVEPLRSAIDALSKGEGTGTYTVALRVLLFASLPDRFRPRLEADVQTLLAGFDAQRHGWPYACGASTSRGTISPSVRHMALLALRSAADAGIEIDGRVVGAAASALLSEVRPDGGWSYRQSDASTGSMTAAAVASILLAMDTNTNMGVRKDRSTALDAVRGGMRWLDDNFKPHPPPGGGRSRGFPTYWLYALE